MPDERTDASKYRQLMENIPDGIYRLDRNTRVCEFSTPMAKFYGFGVDEILGRDFSLFIHPDDRERIVLSFFDAVETRREWTFGLRFRVVSKQGVVHWVEVNSHMQFGETGQYEKENGVIRNIDRIIEAEALMHRNEAHLKEEVAKRTAELKKANQKLTGQLEEVTRARETLREIHELKSQLRQAQKMEAIGTLSAGIAHDFNNILFPVIGNTELLLQDLESHPTARPLLRQTLDGMLRARDLVGQILTFSRQLDTETRPLDIRPVVREALKLMRASLPAFIALEASIHPDCGLVAADPSQVHQIVMNLCTNAFHAMMERGGTLTVSLEELDLRNGSAASHTMPQGKYLCLTVADTGAGMDPGLLAKVFDPYFTTRTGDKGTGLGLSVVRGIVMSLKGQIQVDSTPGSGTAIRVFLPVEKPAPAPRPEPAEPVIYNGDEHILLVDDQVSIVQVMQKILKRLGYRVTACKRGVDALDTFTSDPGLFDLVITDMTMPDLTGDRLAVQLLEIRPDLPIIICTGYMGIIRRELKENPGIKACLPKPVKISELSKTVRQVLDHAHA